MRDAARKGHVAEMHAIFDAHMAEPAAQLDLAKAREIVKDRHAALLCYEADAAGCHRAVVADLLADELGLTIENL